MNKLQYIFERSLLWSPKLHLFDQKYSNIEIVKYYYNLNSILMYFKMQFIPAMQSWIFSIITPVFNYFCYLIINNVSLHYQCWKQCLLIIFVEIVIIFQYSLNNRNFK